MKQLFSSPSFAISGFIIFCLGLFFYSFTQIDLSLTFSHASIFQTIQKMFQYIGYFNRPLSTELFFLIIIGLFCFYILFLDRVREKKVPAKKIWLLIGFVAVLLTLTYNAFSYDVFNYIFDAKIVTQYQENPYLKKALDFPSDPMLSFMRWTHRVYPYGPVWLGLTIPLSFIGLQKFVLTFFIFKSLALGAYLGTVYFLYKTLRKVSPEHAFSGMTFFALNPLVLIESLVSGHNDIVMMFFAVTGIYFLVQKKWIVALLLLIISIGVKFATVFLVPAFLIAIYFFMQKKTIPWEKLFLAMLFLMVLAVIAASFRTTFQPWYLLYMLPFAALLSHRREIFSPMILLTITAIFNYVPYLFTGNWDAPIPGILFNLNLYSASIAIIMYGTFLRRKKSI